MPDVAQEKMLESDDGAAMTQAEIGAIRDMKQELTKLPHHKKSALVHIQRINPSLVDDNILLTFLRADGYNPRNASQRLARYWEARFKLFGAGNFFLPMTLAGALRDSIDALKACFLTLLPCTDDLGRPIIYCRTRNLKRHFHGLGQVRVWWYLIHLLMKNPAAMKRGFVVLSTSKDSSMDNFDTCTVKGICHSGDCMFPIRWKVCHLCHSNPVVPVVSRIVRTVLSVDQRDSFFLHNGSTETVLGSLAKLHLSKESLPVELGGTVDVPSNVFIKKWILLEDNSVFLDHYNVSEGNTPIIDCTETSSINYTSFTTSSQLMGRTQLHPDMASRNANHRRDQTVSSHTIPISSEICRSAGKSINMIEFDAQLKNGSQLNSISSSWANNSNTVSSSNDSEKESLKKSSKKNTNATKRRNTDDATSHPGRTGDPRMNRAVQAKLDDPDMPLITALLRGGFVFPGLDESEGQVSLVRDTENVTVYQRRNQLLRRLRIEKRKNVQK